jgi:hypothetical protein
MGHNLPSWIQQAWFLWKADLLMLIGRKSEAKAVARQAVTRLGRLPLTSSFVGAFDRWLAATSETTQELSEARQLIGAHLNRLSEFDSVDQIEILCAVLRTAEPGHERLRAEEALHNHVAIASPGLVTLLRRLEFIPA